MNWINTHILKMYLNNVVFNYHFSITIIVHKMITKFDDTEQGNYNLGGVE
jgi:hypothetical protein